MREAAPRVEALGGQVLVVSGRAPHQAQKLLDDGSPFPLLLDPDHELRALLGAAGKLTVRSFLSWRGTVAYARALRQRQFFRLESSEAWQQPAAAVLDGSLEVAWTHVGRHLGDYPSIDTVLRELDRVVRSPTS